MSPHVAMRGIVKRFSPAVLANDRIDLDLARGEIVALLGENGAGKSTLMQILYGLHRRDEGTITVGGRPFEPASPADAMAAGIGMIHQEFMLVAPFTVAENLAMGRGDAGPFDLAATAGRIADLARLHGLDVDPHALVEHLPIGVRQRVEILKVLHRGAEVLILDEPTAVLTPNEVAPLLGLLRRFRAADKAVVIVTHKLHEVMAVADRVVVLRGGRVAGEVATGETTEAALARMMVGRDLAAPASRRAAPGLRPALVVSDLEARDDAGRLQVRGVGLEVRAGEILGLAGVDGNGQSTLLEALAGLRPAEGGRVVLDGAELGPLATPARRREAGLGYVPADRGGVGTVRELSIATNAALGTLGRVARLRGWWLDRARMRAEAAAIVERFDVRTPSVDFPAGKLSGGNLQKLILGREIGRAPKVLLVEQPTRGLDVGARDTVWAALLAQREAGCAILLVSAELDEITALADRIAVIVAGRVVGTLARGEADDERLGLMMAGRQGAEPPPPPPVAA